MKTLLHPLAIRIFHWIMAFSVLYMVITGLYLHNPLNGLPYGLVRKTHDIVGIVLLLNLLGQSSYYLLTGKYTEVLFTARDIPNLRSFFRYMLFISEQQPNYGRYNPGQKLMFTSWALAILLSGFVTLPHYFHEQVEWIGRLTGGIMGARVFLYAVTMFFLATIPLHLYLAFAEDPAKFQAIFSGYIKKEPKVHDQGE